MDGFEATRQIRVAEECDSAKSGRCTPIIALTANAINGDRERCLEAGMNDYVSKPLDPVRLINAIQTLLAKSNVIEAAPGVIESAVLPVTIPTGIEGATTKTKVPPLAMDVFFDRCMGNTETILAILDAFESEAISDLAELKLHAAAKDSDATARVAHALKGASGILSADMLSEIAFKLEKMGRTGVFADEDHLLTQLEVEVRRCIEFLPAVRIAIAAKTTAKIAQEFLI
jgi:HPt (histidine-containing phosphotransfer) domain-containing protein